MYSFKFLIFFVLVFGIKFVPEFSQPLENLTVPLGREAVFHCIVNHLGGYRVSACKISLFYKLIVPWFGQRRLTAFPCHISRALGRVRPTIRGRHLQQLLPTNFTIDDKFYEKRQILRKTTNVLSIFYIKTF